jgi:hypothetical protein
VIPRAVVLVLIAAVAVAVPILLLASFDGHPMSQVKIMSVSVCAYVFVFLMCMSRHRSLLTEWVRISYIPMLAFCLAPAVGSTATTFVLFFGTLWAAGNLGYSLAVHRLLQGTEPDILKLPPPSFNIQNSVRELNFNINTVAPFAVLVWTLLMAIITTVQPLRDELDVLFILSYFGWIHAAVWVVFVSAELPVRGVILREQMPEILPALVPGMIIAPAISFISHILSILCSLLLVMTLVGFLWYNVAIYTCFLETATPNTTARGNEDTLRSETPQGKQVKRHAG